MGRLWLFVAAAVLCLVSVAGVRAASPRHAAAAPHAATSHALVPTQAFQHVVHLKAPAKHGHRSGAAQSFAPATSVLFQGLDDTLDANDPLNYGDSRSAATSGAVSADYYVEGVGTAIGVFDKATGALLGADSISDFFHGSGLGKPCVADSTDNFDSPTVMYDALHDRWIVAITASISNDIGPTYECIAASTSGDPVNGSWNMYSVPIVTGGDQYINVDHLAIWADGVYQAADLTCDDACTGYNSGSFILGVRLWAYNLSDLESGAPLRTQTTIGTGWGSGQTFVNTGSLGDADGPVPASFSPATGTPTGRNEYFMSASDANGTTMNFWQWHVDWNTPANGWVGQSAATQTALKVTQTSVFDANGDLPEPAGNSLYTDYDYTELTPQYTNLGGTESLWQTLATEPSNAAVAPHRVRFYQSPINSATGAIGTTFTQQFTYNPDSTLERWLPSEVVDRNGDLALMYSGTNSVQANGPLVFPSIYYTGRLATDPVNTLSQGESLLYQGHGDQVGFSDPTDSSTFIDTFGGNIAALDPNGCDMWLAGQYDIGHPTATDGSGNQWGTVIGSFRFPGCTGQSLSTTLAAGGTADGAAGTGSLTATLSSTSTASGVGGQTVLFTLGGATVGAATTNGAGVATLGGVDTSAYSAGLHAGEVGASFAGTGTYVSSATTGDLLVGTTQSISFSSLPDRTVGDADFNLSATASSGLGVTFSASGPGTCSVTGQTVHLNLGGFCTITASQSGSASFLPAPPVSQTFSVARAAQTITTTGTWSTTTQVVPTSFTASATASSGDAVYFTSDETNCTENATPGSPQNKFIPVQAGATCVITAHQDGNASFAPATLDIPVAISAVKGNQTCTISGTASRRIDQGQPLSTAVTCSSGLDASSFSVQSSSSTVASIAASTLATIAPTASSVTVAASVSDAATVIAKGGAGSSRTFTVTCSCANIVVGQTVSTVGFGTGYNLSGVATAASATAVTFGVASNNPSGVSGAGTLVRSGASESGTTVTLNTTAAHGLTVGTGISVAGMTPAGYNGAFSVATVAGVASITYTDPTSGLGASTVSGTVTPSASGASETGTTVTLTTAAAHAIVVGDTITVSGVGVAGYNGTFTAEAPTSGTTITYEDASTGLAVSGGGSVSSAASGASESGTVVTLNTTTPHGLAPGQTITVAGVGVTGYNVTATTIAPTVGTVVTYSAPTSGLAVSGGGTVSTSSIPACSTGGTPGAETTLFIHSGSCTVQATQDGNGGYNSTLVSKTFTITKGTQSLVWSPTLANIPNSQATVVSAKSNSGLAPGTITSTTPLICTVGSTTATAGQSTVTVTPTGTLGTCTLSAAGNAGSFDWNTLAAASKSYTTANGIPQSITFATHAPESSYFVDDADLSLDPVSDSGLTVSLAASPPAVCTATGTTVHLVGAEGTCTITPSQAGDASYAPASGESATITSITDNVGISTVTTATPTGFVPSQTVTIAGATPTGYNGTFVINAKLSPTSFVFTRSASASTSIADDSTGGAISAPTLFFVVQKHDQSIDFASLASRTYGDADFSVSTTASSGLPVSYAAAGNCTISSSTVHITAAGSCTISANQAGNSAYNPAPTTSQRFTIARATQTISFDPVPTHAYGDTFSVSPTSSAGLPVTLSATGACSVTGFTVQTTAVGTCTLTAHAAGDVNTNPAAKVVRAFSVTKVGQSITFPPIATHAPGDADFDPGATASSGLTVTYTATGPCSITGGGLVHITGTGTCVVTAHQDGDATTEAAPTVTQSFSISTATQTISFAPIADHTFGDAPFPVSASASSGLPVSFSATGQCSVSSDTDTATVTLSGAGACSITAQQPGDVSHDAAAPVTRSFSIAKASQTITFAPLPDHTYGDAGFTPSATASSGLTVSFGVTGNCSLSGGSVQITGAGSCTVTASQAGSADYSAAASVGRTFSIAKADQTIDFSVADHTFGDPDFAISGTASSGLTVSFAKLTGPCTVTGTTVHLTGAGSCVVEATQGGNANYNAAPAVDRSFAVNAASQAITFASIPDHTYGDADFNAGASASSGLAISYSFSGGACTVTGSTVHLTGAGSCSVTASQPGNADYNPASDVTRTFAVAKGSQTITFPVIPGHTVGDANFPISATASSGLTVSFQQVSGPCSVTGTTVHITGGGTCTIEASQAGSSDWLAAPAVQRSFLISNASQTITFPSIPGHTYGDADFAAGASASSGLSVSYSTTGSCSIVSGLVHLTGAGSCDVTASQAGDADYSAAPDVTRSFAIAKASQTITFPAIADHTVGDADFAAGASASSGLAVSYSATGDCSIVSGLVHIVEAGSCTVTASQAGSTNYAAAASIQRTFAIGSGVTAHPTTIKLQRKPATIKHGVTQVTLSATVKSKKLHVHGSVTFLIDEDVVATVPLDASGKASAVVSTPGNPGRHRVQATFSDSSGEFGASSSTVLYLQVK